MRLFRIVAVMAVIWVTSEVIYQLTYRPLACNRIKNRVQTVALEMWDRPDEPSVARRAREGIAAMRQCIAVSPTDPDMYMTLAVNERLIGRLADAAATYRQALRYDRRPELFYNLGMVLLEMNQRESAALAFTEACKFDLNFANRIPDPALVETIVTAVRARQAARQ